MALRPNFPFEYVSYSNIFFIATNKIEIENIYWDGYPNNWKMVFNRPKLPMWHKINVKYKKYAAKTCIPKMGMQVADWSQNEVKVMSLISR